MAFSKTNRREKERMSSQSEPGSRPLLFPTHFIYHADYKAMPPSGENRCAVCGQGFAQTYDARKDKIPSVGDTLLSNSTTNIALLQLGNRVCEACAYSVKAVHQKNFWATPYEWRRFPTDTAPKKAAIIDFLQNPPECPFIICVCVAQKNKTMIHKAVINYNKSFIGVTLCSGIISSVWLSSETIASLRDGARPVSLNQGTPTAHLINYLRKKGVA
jgi:hypothetical protein